MPERRLLLVSVFGPYGVKDDYNEPTGMQMELLNNQITREQGVHSPRVRGTYSYALYLLARNVSVPSVVLDFPSWDEFTAELRNGYTHVGISFIGANAYRAGRMAHHVREHHPGIKILLGGAGTVAPGLDEIVPHDAVCHGEGIRWLREYFGDDPEAPVEGCVFSGPQDLYVYGYRQRTIASSVFPGVGCPNGCDFCHTSHKYRRRYIPFLATGRELFDALRAQEKLYPGARHFMIEDENFLKQRHVARELLEQMTRAGRPYTFIIFSSAENVVELGVDFLVRLGVDVIWVGAESRRSEYGKNSRADVGEVIGQLRAKGIKVIGSSILFLDHHTRDNIEEDIDWAIGLRADLHQFMALSPCPGTTLWERLQSERRIIEGFPLHQTSGQDRIWFRHPHFAPEETAGYLRRAFRKNYRVNGPSILNIAHTSARGYRQALADHRRRQWEGRSWNHETLRYEKPAEPAGPDRFFEQRLEALRERTVRYRPILLAAWCFSPNRAARGKCREVAALYRELFGKPTLRDRVESAVVLACATIEATWIAVRRLLGRGDILRQPPRVRREYDGRPAGRRSRRDGALPMWSGHGERAPTGAR